MFIRTGGQVSVRVVNVTWTDLDSQNANEPRGQLQCENE
jgi:hypothetical protein